VTAATAPEIPIASAPNVPELTGAQETEDFTPAN
jgi:hypothetical protein